VEKRAECGESVLGITLAPGGGARRRDGRHLGGGYSCADLKFCNFATFDRGGSYRNEGLSSEKLS
jgi:hypothetical protein